MYTCVYHASSAYIYTHIYNTYNIYIYIYANLQIVRLDHPQSGDNLGQETFLHSL